MHAVACSMKKQDIRFLIKFLELSRELIKLLEDENAT